jgi:hypothetical protein
MQAIGTADLVEEKLDLLLRPEIVKRRKRDPSEFKTRVAIPIRITGTFDEPVFRADVKNFAKDKLLDEIGGKDSDIRKQADELIKGILGGD